MLNIFKKKRNFPQKTRKELLFNLQQHQSKIDQCKNQVKKAIHEHHIKLIQEDLNKLK